MDAVAAVGAELSHDPLWWCGLLIEFASSLSGTLGKQSWRLAALAAPGPLCPAIQRSRAALWLYVLGAVLTLVEPPLDSVALTLAPVSIISTCAGLSVAWNVVLAPCTLGETVRRAQPAAALASPHPPTAGARRKIRAQLTVVRVGVRW